MRWLIRISAGLTAAVVLAAGGLTATGHLRMQPVLSGSMRPAMQPGDLALTWQVPTSSLKVGDVVMFTPPDHKRPVMHRITRITHPQGKFDIVTRGDANGGRDDPWGMITIRSTKIYRTVGSIPYLGWVREAPLGIVRPLLFITAGLILLWIVYTSFRRKPGEGPSAGPDAKSIGGRGRRSNA